MREVAEQYGIRPLVRFGASVERAVWSEATATWTLTIAGGESVEADSVIGATGMFGTPLVPDIAGLDSFTGTVMHTARWDWSHDIAGERIAVIGSAASAVQLVPEIVKTAGQVHLFQRTANWVLPKRDTPFTPEQIEAFRADPSLMAGFRQLVFDSTEKAITFEDREACAAFEATGLEAIAVVRDPAVRAKLTPDHPWGCKRPLTSNAWYPAFNEPNLELVTDPIERITPTGVVTADGVERTVDTIVLATGYDTQSYISAIDVVGRGGVSIRDAWADGPIAYLGITTVGFPNLFMLYGPNTNNGSIITMIEYQVEHVIGLLGLLGSSAASTVEVRPETMATYNEDLQRALDGIEPWQAGCSTYYRNAAGRIVTQYPHTMTVYRSRTEHVDPADYVLA